MPIFVEDRQQLTSRLAFLRIAVATVFVCIAAAFWYLQVAQYAHFRDRAQNNHMRTLALRAPRGMLFDRHGRVLVENRYAFDVSLVREQTTDLARTLGLVSRLTGTPRETLDEIVGRHAAEPRYRPVTLVADASLDQIAGLLARRLELPDIIIEQVPTRQYPTDALAAHLFGYVGEVTDAQLKNKGDLDLHVGTIVGQSGLEQIYNGLLMGRDGVRRVVVNSLGREIETLGEAAPTEGRRLQLTIDYDLQRAAEEAFRSSGFRGSAVILEPGTGEVLALVSLPAYDPNRFAAGIDRGTWLALTTDALRPLQNRAIQGRYSPGSTFKIVVAAAALEEGVVTPEHQVFCRGGATFHGRFFKCHLSGGHGFVDMRHAIEKSCNVYFYTVGNMLGVDRIHKWAERLGLTGKSGIDLPHEVDSLVPSTEWKRQRTGEKWYAGETISVSIGQGQVSVTPIAQAVMMATIANGGTRVVPHLVRAVDQGAGWVPFAPERQPLVSQLKPETVAALHDGLWMVVNGQGTGRRGRMDDVAVAGKTGTAQVISNQGRAAARNSTRDLRDHGWFVFFAPKEDPALAGVVFAEHAEHGYLAAPIARHIIETWAAKQRGRELPVFQAPPSPGVVVASGAPPRPTGRLTGGD